MEPLLVIDLLNECSDAGFGVSEIPIAPSIDFFAFECLHETLGPSVVPGIAWPAHAHDDAGSLQLFNVFSTRVLNTPVGMVNQSGSRLTLIESHLQSLLSDTAV